MKYIGISLIHGIECCTPSFSLLISGGGAACVRRGCPHSNANSNTVPGVVFAKTVEAGCSGQPANVKTPALHRTYLCLRVLPSTMWEALESVTACQWQRDDLIQHCKIFFFFLLLLFFFLLFYFWLCLINLGTLVGSWQQACKVRFVHCSLSLMKWSVTGARKLGWSGLMWVSWW